MWTLEKIQQHIDDQIEESLHLDYKAADSLMKSEGKKNEISKDVSAFANSDGGTIIYGVKEIISGPNRLPEKFDAIDRNQFSKESLEQIINSKISPKIQGIIITPIPVGNLSNNHVIYVVTIPKGTTAHQASDKRYYRRYNFMSEPMEDWEIKDVINRQTKSNVTSIFRPTFTLKAYNACLNGSAPADARLKFEIWVFNEGNKVVKYCDVIIAGKKEVAASIYPKPNPLPRENYWELYYSNTKNHIVNFQDEEVIVSTYQIHVMPETQKMIGEITFFPSFFISNHEVRITITTDDNAITSNKRGQEIIEEYFFE